MILYNRKVKSFAFPTVPLKALLLKPAQYGANEQSRERFCQAEPRYIRITDINEFGLLSDENALGATADKIEPKYLLKENDLLFARSGATAGKSYIHKAGLPYSCFFAGYMIRIVVNSAKVLPGYIFAYTQLSPYKEWVVAIQRAAGQPNINAEEFKSLQIPMPPISVQRVLSEKLFSAYSIKKAKDLNGYRAQTEIDEYLLSKLSLKMPNVGSPLKERVFTVMLRSLSGDRLDPEYNNVSKYGPFLDALRLCKYPAQKLKSIALDVFQGVGRDLTTDPKYTLLKVKNILRNNQIDYTDVEFVKSVQQKKILQPNDIITPFIGEAIRQNKFSVFLPPEDRFYTADNNTGIIRINQNIADPLYIAEYFNSIIGKIQISRLIGGGGVPFLGASHAHRLVINLPSLNEQKEISSHIDSIRSKARKLQIEGAQILEDTKTEMEHILLGV
jgi:restriction endonuclease S subunit